MPGPHDTYIAYGQGWANVSNTPFREYKHWVHEGGISTPLIAHWPAGIKSARRIAVRTPGHLIDIMATCVDVRRGGVSQVNTGTRRFSRWKATAFARVRRQAAGTQRAIYWEHEGNRAIAWATGSSSPKDRAAMGALRHGEDRSELHDLVIEQPDKARELIEKWEAWAKRVTFCRGHGRKTRSSMRQGRRRNRQRPATRPSHEDERANCSTFARIRREG